jgi:AraC-type transcriptional regulator N-terminus
MDDGETREEVLMNVMIHQPVEREAQRVQANREELVERIARAMREDGTVQPLQGLYLSRCSLPLQPFHSVLEPSVCVIAQGSKEVLLGNSRYRITTPPTSIVSTKASSASLRCATCNCCGKRSALSLADEPD